MMIWRNLDPKVLGELLIAAAETFAAKRKAGAGSQPSRIPFRLTLATVAQPHRPARHPRA